MVTVILRSSGVVRGQRVKSSESLQLRVVMSESFQISQECLVNNGLPNLYFGSTLKVIWGQRGQAKGGQSV